MDVVQYFKTRNRMVQMDKKNLCNFECSACRLSADNNGRKIDCTTFEREYPEEAVKIVSDWGEKHPVKTRQSEILKIFPNIPKTPDGYLNICPQELVPFRCDTNTECGACLQDFWSMEISIE